MFNVKDYLRVKFTSLKIQVLKETRKAAGDCVLRAPPALTWKVSSCMLFLAWICHHARNQF